MAPIQRLKATEIQNGQTIDADDINAELDQLVNTSNAQDTSITTLTSSNTTLSGVKTFSNGIKANTIGEATATSGVTVDGVRHRDGLVYPYTATSPSSPEEGEVWFNGEHNSFQAQWNGEPRLLLTAPKNWAGGPVPSYVDTDTVRLPKGLIVMDDTGQTFIEVTATNGLEIDASVNGTLGLDFGSKTVDTWYYIWLCKGSNGVTAVLSTSMTAPVIPSGYEDYKRRYPYLALRSDFNNEFLRFEINPVTKEVFYPVPSFDTPNYMFMNGVQVTDTPAAFSLDFVMPPISRWAKILINTTTPSSMGLRLSVQDATLDNLGYLGQNHLWVRSSTATLRVVEVTTNDLQQIIMYANGSHITVTAAVIGWTASNEEAL